MLFHKKQSGRKQKQGLPAVTLQANISVTQSPVTVSYVSFSLCLFHSTPPPSSLLLVLCSCYCSAWLLEIPKNSCHKKWSVIPGPTWRADFYRKYYYCLSYFLQLHFEVGAGSSVTSLSLYFCSRGYTPPPQNVAFYTLQFQGLKSQSVAFAF